MRQLRGFAHMIISPAVLTNQAVRRCKVKGIAFDEARCVVFEGGDRGLELFAVVYDAEAPATKRRAKKAHPSRRIHVWTLKTLSEQENKRAAA